MSMHPETDRYLNDKDRGPHEVRLILRQVRAGYASVAYASVVLDWLVEEVQMAVWGRVVQ